MYEKLKEYAKETMKSKMKADIEQRKDWIYGAVKFAQSTGQISSLQAYEIMEQYGIL